MFNRLKDGISKSMTTMNVNSNINLETNKLKLMIENTRRAIEELVKEMGWAAYRAMKEPDTDLSLLKNYVKNIDEKKQEITFFVFYGMAKYVPGQKTGGGYFPFFYDSGVNVFDYQCRDFFQGRKTYFKSYFQSGYRIFE